MKKTTFFKKTSNLLFVFGIISYLLAGFFTLQENVSWLLFVLVGVVLFMLAFYYRSYKDN